MTPGRFHLQQVTPKHITMLCIAALLAYWVHFWPTFHAANESIRLYFVQAVVDHGTASVDTPRQRYGMSNVDKAHYQGHDYMDKAPGLSPAHHARILGSDSRVGHVYRLPRPPQAELSAPALWGPAPRSARSNRYSLHYPEPSRTYRGYRTSRTIWGACRGPRDSVRPLLHVVF